MFFGKKLKAFSMVELMMVLLISALIIAAIVPIITRKHLQLPTVASHGAYLCYYGPRGIDDTTGEITDRTVVLREARWSGSGYTRKVFDRPTANCVFDPPKKAAFFQITAVGGGGGGSDSGYKGSIPTQTQTGEHTFNPFLITEDYLKEIEVEYDTFKANAGWVAAFAQSRKSGKGGDMGWYKYQEIFNPGRCIEYYQKVQVQTNEGAKVTNHVLKSQTWVQDTEGTPGKAPYWEYNGKKFIKQNGDPIYEDRPCCNDIGAHNDPSNTCWSCYTPPGECKDGVDTWVWARLVGEEPHFEEDGTTGWSDVDSTIPPIVPTDLGDDKYYNGKACQPCKRVKGLSFYPKCDRSNPNVCSFSKEEVCNPSEKCPGFLEPDEPIPCNEEGHTYYNGQLVTLCEPECETRPEWQVQVPNDGWVSEEIHGVAAYDLEHCKYKLKKWAKRFVFKPCYGGYYTTPSEVCDNIANPDENCPVWTGNYSTVCYEINTETGAIGNEIPCPSDNPDEWTYHAEVAPTSGTGHWDYVYDDVEVDAPAEYEWRCPEGTAEDPADPTGPCKCKNSTIDEKITTYRRTDSDRVVGGAGGNGTRCATPYVPGDAKGNMLKYYDASNRSTGDYGVSYPDGLTNVAEYGMYFTALVDGNDGESMNVGGNSTVGDLTSVGWAASSHPGSIFASYGYVPCANINYPYDTKQETTCSTGRKPSWSEVRIQKGSSEYYWTKAYSASKGGGPGGRNEYTSVYVDGTDGTFIGPDRSETTGHITDVDGNEIDVPVRLNSPNYSKVTPGVNGVCETSPNTKYKKASDSEFSEIFSVVSPSDLPYGYVLKHKNGTVELAGQYKTYKYHDENSLSVGIEGKPGEAFTTLKRSIPADERTIVVGVGGSAAGMGTGAAGSPGSKTFMGTLIEVNGGDGGQGVSAPRFYDYQTMMGKVYDAVKYMKEDVCYFANKFSTLPASVTTYMGRDRASYQAYAASNPGMCAAYTSMSDYKYHILEGAEMGGYPDYVGGIPTFNVEATSPVAASAFEKAGMGGQGGGVEHFCMTSQKIIVFEDKIDFKASVFREDALIPGTPEYESLFGSGAPFHGQDAGFSQVDSKHKIPRDCYRNEPGLKPAYNHVAAGNGKDGILLIRW